MLPWTLLSTECHTWVIFATALYQKGLGLNLISDTSYPDLRFSLFSSLPQTSASIMPWNRPLLLTPTFFSTECSLSSYHLKLYNLCSWKELLNNTRIDQWTLFFKWQLINKQSNVPGGGKEREICNCGHRENVHLLQEPGNTVIWVSTQKHNIAPSMELPMRFNFVLCLLHPSQTDEGVLILLISPQN